MEHGAEQLESMVVSEVTRTAKQITDEVENENTDPERMAKEALHEMEHLTKEAVKVAEIVTGTASKGWGNGSVERSQEWDVKY